MTDRSLNDKSVIHKLVIEARLKSQAQVIDYLKSVNLSVNSTAAIGKITTIDRGFCSSLRRMQSTFQCIVAGKILALGTGNLMQSFGLGGTLGKHPPNLD
jgi:hypothetical protein